MKPSYHNIGDAFADWFGVGGDLPDYYKSMGTAGQAAYVKTIDTKGYLSDEDRTILDSAGISYPAPAPTPAPAAAPAPAAPPVAAPSKSDAGYFPQQDPTAYPPLPTDQSSSVPAGFFPQQNASAYPPLPTSAATAAVPAQVAPAAAGRGGMGGMPLNYGAAFASLFNSAGDMMQDQADSDARDAEARKVKEQKSKIDRDFGIMQRDLDVQKQIANVKPSPAAAAKLKLAQQRLATVQQRHSAFLQQHPEYAPKKEKPKTSTMTYALIGGAVLALGGATIFFIKRRK